jgi:hypothetical protein
MISKKHLNCTTIEILVFPAGYDNLIMVQIILCAFCLIYLVDCILLFLIYLTRMVNVETVTGKIERVGLNNR